MWNVLSGDDTPGSSLVSSWPQVLHGIPDPLQQFPLYDPLGLAGLPLLGDVGIIGFYMGCNFNLGAHVIDGDKPDVHRVSDLGVEAQSKLGFFSDLFQVMQA